MRHIKSRTIGAAILVLGLALAGCAEKPSTSGGDPSSGPKSTFPESGKVVRMIVPYGVGGGTDIGARLLANDMGKLLDTTINVENKVGASGQIGLTELVSAKPDGYTIAWANAPITSPIYLDPSRKAAFKSEDLVPLGNYVFDPALLVVSKDSPYKTLGDLVNAAKAQPGKIAVSASAVLAPGDMVIRALEAAAGVKFSTVYFDTAGQQRSALLGGQVAVESGSISEAAGALRSGQVRGLTIFDATESKFAPGVPTAKSEGYAVEWGSSRILVVPKGTPQEVIDVWTKAIKDASDQEASRGDFDKAFLTQRYMDPAATAAYVKTIDQQVQVFLDQVAKK